MKYGFEDERFIPEEPEWTTKRVLGAAAMVLLICAVWFALDQKLLFGEDWISATYDSESWRTNEGNLPTYGAWDIETHIWKTEYIVENFPHFQWNPLWYMGMPLIKYYQAGFYLASALVMTLLGTSAARAALLLVIFGHLAATLLTFLLCYKLSRRLWVAGLSSLFVLANTFISLRSYGWEPITVVFLFLFPLGLYFFLKDPTRPFRVSLILTMAAAYLSHPLLFFALCMTMGLYLLSLALRRDLDEEVAQRHFIWKYFAVIGTSLLIGAPQFLLQMSYHQATSGAHMGVSYLPYYQVPFNIISPVDFFFDAGNLKGPGLVVMIAFALLIVFGTAEYHRRKHRGMREGEPTGGNAIARGLATVLVTMVLFYYLELFNIFPMNVFRHFQYHRIIPEFIIVACALIAVLYRVAYTPKRRVFYYAMLISFALATIPVIHGVQDRWETTSTIADSEEWISEEFEGRISHPYTDQSLSVRNSYTQTPQVYGYYEQGITNSYADELFSVSSGYHNAELTTLYLQAANVRRLYTNQEAGHRDEITRARLDTELPYNEQNGSRYGYFEVPLADASPAQAISGEQVRAIEQHKTGCREMFQVTYCGSTGEEFVTKDPAENAYLRAYVQALEQNHTADAHMTRINPDRYEVHVQGADEDTAVVIKMTHDQDFQAATDGQTIDIQRIGPDFMLLEPQRTGDYTIQLTYHTPRQALFGAGVSVATIIALIAFFALRTRIRTPQSLRFEEGDL